MMPSSLRSWVGAALFGVALASVPACFAEVEPDVEYADGYRPLYYDGYMVYYDGVGRPFYYMNGAPIWIGAGSPFYGRAAAHWNTYGRYYGHWYGHYGYRYRGYRGRR